MMHYWGQPFARGYGFWGGGLIGLIIMAFFWLMIAFLFVGLIRGFRRGRGEDGGFEGESSDKALDILRERYAKGEINKKEFEEMKKDIAKRD